MLCARGRTLEDPGPAFSGKSAITRTGHVIAIEGEVRTDEPGYVVGRDVSEAVVRRAARGFRVGPGRSSHIEADAIPDGFRRRASAPIVPLSTFNPGRYESIALDARSTAAVMTSHLDSQSRQVWDFFRSTLGQQHCEFATPTLTEVGPNVAAVAITGPGGRSRPAAQVVVRVLRIGTAAGVAADTAQAAHPSVSTVAADCAGSFPSTLGGTRENFAWVIAFDPATPGLTCTAARQGARRLGVVTGGGTFAATSTPAGTVELIDRVELDGVGILAGRVEASVGRVTVASANTAAVDAELRQVTQDSTHRYWVLFSPSSPPVGPIAVTAYGSDGTPVATLRSPP